MQEADGAFATEDCDAGEGGIHGAQYAVMELLRGGDLEEYIQDCACAAVIFHLSFLSPSLIRVVSSVLWT